MNQSDSDEQNYQVNVTDFTMTDSTRGNPSYAYSGTWGAEPDNTYTEANYFYTKLGFEVGTFCNGSKRFYSQKGK